MKIVILIKTFITPLNTSTYEKEINRISNVKENRSVCYDVYCLKLFKPKQHKFKICLISV